MNVESSVLFVKFFLLNHLLWLLYLSLIFVLVIPIYKICSFSRSTGGVYKMQPERQFHLVVIVVYNCICLQLHLCFLYIYSYF